jgi:hypothetical protein
MAIATPPVLLADFPRPVLFDLTAARFLSNSARQIRLSSSPKMLTRHLRQASSQGHIRTQLVLYLTPFLNAPQPQNQ